MKLDPTDLAILDAMRDNARISNREVSRLLGISEGTVRQRLKRMADTGAMRLGVVADMATAGFSAGVIVRLRTVPNRAAAIARQVAQLRCCAFSGLTLGRYDVLVYLIGTDRQEVAALIDSQIAPLDGVVEIDVKEPVGSAKHRYDMVWIE